MKEITFLKQNSRKWEEFEKKLDDKRNLHPAEVTDMFVELTDDYSYSKSNYPQSKTTGYLGGMAARIHQYVYRNKKESNRRIFDFWRREVPALFGKYHRFLLLSFVITAVATLLGFISQLSDDNFVRVIIGDGYVDETIERIKKGNPIGVYGDHPQLFSFFYITTNNIRVAFYALVLGMTFSLGTAFVLIQNGIMLGSFFAMFYQYNVLGKALKVVWIHGTLEISAIVIAGCAGFVLGSSYMFPGTFKRSDSFKRGAKDSVKIVIGLIPIFICAGFLESFITRYTEMALPLSLTIIFGSLAFIVWYFIILPINLSRRTKGPTVN